MLFVFEICNSSLFTFSGCNGYENGVEYCQWGRRRMGSGVCDHHPNLGLRCQFHQHFMNKFYLQKCFAQFFSSYSLALQFHGTQILAQNLLVKCWWNWLQVSTLSPPSKQVCPGSLERPEIWERSIPERFDCRKYSICFVFAISFATRWNFRSRTRKI